MVSTRPTSIGRLLADAVRRRPRHTFLRIGEESVTYAEFGARVDRCLAGFAEAGLRRDAHVGLLMATSVDQVVLWFALAEYGCIHVPINPALKARNLHHVLTLAEIDTLVLDAAYLESLSDDPGRATPVRRLYVRGERDAVCAFAEARPVEDLLHGAGPRPDPSPRPPLEIASLLFTSGTTGPSKACALSGHYLVRQAQIHSARLNIGPDDILFSPFPLFHIDAAVLTVLAALSQRCTAVLAERFSASRFWSQIRQSRATVFNFMGMTQTVLWRAAPSDDDRRHGVRLAWGGPMPDFHPAWAERFGFPLVEVFGSTDAGVFAYDDLEVGHEDGYCGRIIDEFEAKVIGEDGSIRAAGDVGRLVVRGREPGLTMSSYFGMPAETSETIDAAGWVTTGDLATLDEQGRLTFRGRASDSIRRRGENISAYEIETVLQSHPEIEQSAAIGIPSELTEEDVKVCIVRRVGSRMTVEAVLDFCHSELPPFMVPRYVEFLDALPLTPTAKVAKADLVADHLARKT